MISMQDYFEQLILNNLTGSEQPQEEVQLTELRPVKQSRIRENVKDTDATDALRALRSFSGDCDDGESIDQREFNSCKSVEQSEYQGGKLQRVEAHRKRTEDIRNTGKIGNEVTVELVCNDEKIAHVKAPRRKLVKSSKKDREKPDDITERDGITEKENPEKELRLRIDAIIQANYLLERENVVEELEIVEHTDTPSAAASTKACVKNAENSDSSVCNSVEEEETTRKTRNRTYKIKQDLQKKYFCIICDARFKGSGGLRNHYKVVHDTGPVFKCHDCGKEFKLKERLKLHVRMHTGFKPYKCSDCDKAFARGGQLLQHRRTHTQVRPFHCELCSTTFTCMANLSLHLKRHTGQKDHKCDLCGRAFVRRDALKKHLECLHRDVKSFLCGICNKTFKGHLPQHMRTHAKDRPHGCATCGQRFAQKSQLTVHQRTHSGQRPFRCLVCWQAFAHSTALKLHTRRHTGERPFKCTDCNTGFTQLPHWKKHMKCVHGRDNPYGCKRCKNFFRIKSDLENHEKTCHPEAEEEDDDGNVSSKPAGGSEIVEKTSVTAKYKMMTVEKMRLLLAVLLKRISRQERLDELGFGKRLIDDVLQDSLVSAGKEPVTGSGLSELEALTRNLEIFLEWTVPKEHLETFRKMKKSPEDILETLTAT
ncbi:uncharacterized protein LOC143895170 [Temnothorax americanus]|uniref:uncharacterized protein LOC143895170 n=1 Tax=Temnothorax americanus TaxID=1964332 RepID=UPI004067EEC4